MFIHPSLDGAVLFLMCVIFHRRLHKRPQRGTMRAYMLFVYTVYLHPWHMSGRPPGFLLEASLHYIPNQFMVSCTTRYLRLIASYVRFHSTCGCTLIIARKKHETHEPVVSFLSNRKVWYRKIAWGEVRGSDGAFGRVTPAISVNPLTCFGISLVSSPSSESGRRPMTAHGDRAQRHVSAYSGGKCRTQHRANTTVKPGPLTI